MLGTLFLFTLSTLVTKRHAPIFYNGVLCNYLMDKLPVNLVIHNLLYFEFLRDENCPLSKVFHRIFFKGGDTGAQTYETYHCTRGLTFSCNLTFTAIQQVNHCHLHSFLKMKLTESFQSLSLSNFTFTSRIYMGIYKKRGRHLSLTYTLPGYISTTSLVSSHTQSLSVYHGDSTSFLTSPMLICT